MRGTWDLRYEILNMGWNVECENDMERGMLDTDYEVRKMITIIIIRV